MPNYSGELNTFAVLQIKDGQVVHWQPIPRQQFILIASGLMRSKCNPEGVDFFEQHGIPLCDAWYDKAFSRYRIACPNVDNLWKLRFSKHPKSSPSENEAEKGWAGGEFGPTESQLGKLHVFGIYDLDDFAFGDKCFELIRATSDPAWVSQY
jgi:hypothetical protein